MNDAKHSAGEREGLVGRGGLKLEAAIARFELQGAIRAARAVDVGASTGGFTEVLLHHGAAHVLAVDAGHGQLHERLKTDVRVQNLERTDWKRLSLAQAVAAGPFDFFTVDVSFVAARNMLRGLAFRLRPGAVGVVLIKPQFELPDHLVKRGDVHDPGLRRLAVSKFATKALALGFEVRRHIDSPVPGGEGTVEILAELVFHGRTERLPAFPGAEVLPDAEAPTSGATSGARIPGRRAPGPRAARVAPLFASELHRFFAVTAPGTEEIAAHELTTLVRGAAAPDVSPVPGSGYEDVRAVPGGVEWRGSLHDAFRANLQLRVPTRILLRLGEIRAREFGKLRHQLARLPWERFMSKDTPLHVSVSATRSRLYHTGAIEEALLAAVGDRLGTGPAARAVADRDDAPDVAPDVAEANDGAGDSPSRPPAQRVLIRGMDDVWTVSVDSSGERLHRRGWRTDSGEAPMRETLAAALLYFAGWHPELALVDAMCGAGTLPIEAATMALGLWPGARRAFAFERWPGLSSVERERWEDLRRASLSPPEGVSAVSNPAPILASDRDADAIAATRRNATRAGVADRVQIAQHPMNEVEPPAPTGIFVANPPYGERLGTRRDLPALYRAIGGLLRGRFAGWSATVVVPDVRLASAFRLPVAASQKLTHGGLRVTLLRFAPWAPAAKPSA